ncbi:hypothetical protein HCJ92_18865, partial [Streptomyces sp. ventii]|nr:hypothetical protein [Streptomyces spiramenti]
PRAGGDRHIPARGLLPAALAVSAVAVPSAAHRYGPPPGGSTTVLALTALTALAALVALGAALRRRLPAGRPTAASLSAAVGALLLVGHALGGGWLLAEVARGAPTAPDAARTAAQTALVLAAAVAPALWTADRFVAAARQRLVGSRTLRELTSAVRPLLLATVAGFGAALAGVLAVVTLLPPLVPGGPSVWPVPAATQLAAVLALGLLLHTALLLTCGGRRTAAALALVAASVVLTAALSLVAASWLPGLSALARPVEALVAAGGPPLLTATVAGVAWLVLLVVAWRTLTGPWAHHGTPDGEPAARSGRPGPAAAGGECGHGGDARGPVGHAPPTGWDADPVRRFRGRARGGGGSRADCAAAGTPALPPPRR